MTAPLATRMSPHTRALLGTGAVSAMLAVMCGAFGAHALRTVMTPAQLAIYHTGAQYQFYHSLGVLIIGVLTVLLPTRRTLRWAGWLMVAGIVLFSGSLYMLALTGVRVLGAITPLGGVAFIVAWALVAVTVMRGH